MFLKVLRFVLLLFVMKMFIPNFVVPKNRRQQDYEYMYYVVPRYVVVAFASNGMKRRTAAAATALAPASMSIPLGSSVESGAGSSTSGDEREAISGICL